MTPEQSMWAAYLDRRLADLSYNTNTSNIKRHSLAVGEAESFFFMDHGRWAEQREWICSILDIEPSCLRDKALKVCAERDPSLREYKPKRRRVPTNKEQAALVFMRRAVNMLPVPLEVLSSGKRGETIAACRAVFLVAAIRIGGATRSSAARFIGKQHHMSLSALELHESRMKDPTYRTLYERLTGLVRRKEAA